MKSTFQISEHRSLDRMSCRSTDMLRRLRQTDVKAGHYERKVQALEAARDQWETKYEEMAKKYADTKKELDDFVAEIGTI